jgi:hypothetical protein
VSSVVWCGVVWCGGTARAAGTAPGLNATCMHAMARHQHRLPLVAHVCVCVCVVQWRPCRQQARAAGVSSSTARRRRVGRWRRRRRPWQQQKGGQQRRDW